MENQHLAPLKEKLQNRELALADKTQLLEFQFRKLNGILSSSVPAILVAALFFFFATKQGTKITIPNVSITILVAVAVFSYVYQIGRQSASWLQFYIDNGSPYDCIRDYFLPDFKVQRDLKIKNYDLRFLRKHKLSPTEVEIKTQFMHNGEIMGQKIQVSKYEENALLLTLFYDKNLLNSDLYISLQDKKLVNNIKLPAAQTFNYFPEWEQSFNFYTEQKAETAQFLQNNEVAFNQLMEFAKYRKYNFFIAVLENQLSCVLPVSYTHLWADAKDKVILDDIKLRNFANEMLVVRELLDILLQLK